MLPLEYALNRDKLKVEKDPCVNEEHKMSLKAVKDMPDTDPENHKLGNSYPLTISNS